MTAAEGLMVLGILLFAAGEVLALSGPDLTASERVRIWTGRSSARRLALAVLLVLLYTHTVHGWPW